MSEICYTRVRRACQVIKTFYFQWWYLNGCTINFHVFTDKLVKYLFIALSSSANVPKGCCLQLMLIQEPFESSLAKKCTFNQF